MSLSATDGRRARAERHREAVARALLAFMRETGDLPTVDQVAARADVSKRTVYRLFEDLSTLQSAAVEIMRDDVLRLFPPPMPGPEGVDVRVSRLVAHRAKLYEHVMPIRTVAERIRHSAPAIEAALQNDRHAFRSHVALLFADHLTNSGHPAEECLHAIELVTSWHAWRTLRAVQDCSIARAKRVVESSLRATLGLATSATEATVDVT